MRGITMALLLLGALGCEERERPPPPPSGDAGDFDAAAIEAGPRRDAGPRGVVIDGIVSDREWGSAAGVSAAVDTDRPGSVLSRLRARIDEGTLYVAIEGTIAAGDVMVLYVDHALGDTEGVSDLGTLVDDMPALDDAISSLLSTPASFAADYAWGTTAMGRTPVGLDAETGWREIAEGRDHRWVASELAPSACSETACETGIGLATLGGAAPRTIAMFARIVTAGGWTNQTLPEDDAGAPEIVSAVFSIDDGSPGVDAGVTDGGGAPDGGVASIRVDGRIDPGEWAAGSVLTNVVVPLGAFVGNEVTALHTLRDATTLYIAVEGTLTFGNAIVVYVDHDLYGADGIASPTPLDDVIGGLDTALSKSMITPSELRLDMAWGTLDMARDATVGDDRMGWRGIGANPSLFADIPGMSSCGTDVCEASVALRDLGVAAADDIGIYVRLVSATSTAFSNQTLPADDGFAPELITTFAIVSPP